MYDFISVLKQKFSVKNHAYYQMFQLPDFINILKFLTALILRQN